MLELLKDLRKGTKSLKLIIDLSKKPTLILREKKYTWDGLYQLSETLLLEIDGFLKKNKIKLEDIKEIEVVPSKESIVSTRISEAVAQALLTK